MTDMTNWKNADPDGEHIPHEDGKIKWYAIGMQDDDYYYIGEYDMTDWDKTFEEVFKDAKDYVDENFMTDQWQILRKDQVVETMWNLAFALNDSGDYKKHWIGVDFFDDWNEE